MKDLPSWVKEVLDNKNLSCGKCNKVFALKDLCSVGIERSSKNKEKNVLFLGIICENCGETTNFQLQEMTLLDLAFEVLEEQSKEQTDKTKKELDAEMGIKKRQKVKRNVRSKITLKEIKDHADFLKTVKTHDEFLLALGMSLDEIEENNFKGESQE